MDDKNQTLEQIRQMVGPGGKNRKLDKFEYPTERLRREKLRQVERAKRRK